MTYRKKPDGIFRDPLTGRTYEHNGYSRRIYWSPQMLDDLRRLFPTTLNEHLAEHLRVSPRTMIRKARQLGLRKDPVWLQQLWDQRRKMAQFENRRKGYPGGFQKGVRSSPDTEFRKGRILPPEVEQRRRESLRKAWQRRKLNVPTKSHSPQ